MTIALKFKMIFDVDVVIRIGFGSIKGIVSSKTPFLSIIARINLLNVYLTLNIGKNSSMLRDFIVFEC